MVQYVGPVQSTQVQITTTIASHSDDSPTCSIGRVHSGLNVLGLVDAPIWSQLDVFKFVESRVAISRVFFLEDRHLKLPILQFRRFFALSSLSGTMFGSRWRSVFHKASGSRLRHHRAAGTYVFSDVKAELVKCKWDAIVVGGGHNGLTAAAYLARAGVKVAVLERRSVLGGAAVTEEIFPGFKFSRCSYVQSLLRPTIIRDLQLFKHGLKLLPRVPSSFTPTTDGNSLLLGADMEFNQSQISKFSKHDASAFPGYVEQLERFCAIMDPLLDVAPPEKRVGRSITRGRLWEGLETTKVFAGLLRRFAAAGPADTLAFMELLLAPASKVLDGWFESDILKATLATDAVIGAMVSVKSPGTGYVLLHHVMGETDGARGVWSYVEGGMGGVSKALAGAAVEAGATLVTEVEVEHFKLKAGSENEAVDGVVLADGTEIFADRVLSNATPYVTFLKLLPADVLPQDFLKRIKTIDYKSGTTKINVAVDSLPLFSACKSSKNIPGPEHQGTIHLGADRLVELEEQLEEI